MADTGKTIIVVQARMGSTRLPGKSLMKIFGEYTLIDMVLRRMLASVETSCVVLATSVDSSCDRLAGKAESMGCRVLRGDEKDVLSRFAAVYRHYKPDNIVRVCADNPFVAPSEIDKLIVFFRNGGFDYACNKIPESGLPDGFGAEIIRGKLLDKIDVLAIELPDREHVTKYVVDRPGIYSHGLLKADKSLFHPEIKLDIDTAEDLRKIAGICEYLNPDNAPLWTCGEIIKAYFRYENKE